MIQFNLLPDVKIEYIRARRLKRTVVLVAGTVASASLILLIMLFLAVGIFQKKHLNDLSRDITASRKQLEGVQDLDKILTVQNQLNSLPALHKAKPVTTRLFGYIQQITPTKVSVETMTLKYADQTISINGKADSIETVNKYIDTIKFTTFVSTDKTTKNAFTSVVLTNFSRTDKDATYLIDLKFDPEIFDSASNVVLTVPKTITTRSEVERPDALFQ